MGRIIIAGGGLPADYYVAKHGSDSNDGSFGSPWLTIGKAASSIDAGSVVSVGPGVYAERVTIAAAKSGTAGNETQFVASGSVCVTKGFEVQSSYTILDGFEITPGDATISDVDYRGQVYVKNEYVTLRNLDLHDLNVASAVCLYCDATGTRGNYVTIEDCTFERIPWNAVSVSNGSATGYHATDVTMRRCTVSKFQGNEGIKAYGDRWLIEDCSVQGPLLAEMTRTSVDGDGIRINYGDGTIIRRTNIYDVWQHTQYTPSGYHTDGIQLWSGVTNLTIDGCIIGSWKPEGYDGTPGPMNSVMIGTCNTDCDVTIQNCLLLCGIETGALKSNAHTGCGGAATGSTATIRLYNNTMFGNYPAYNGANAAVTAYNNVFYSHRSGYYADASSSDYNAFMWAQWTDSSVSSGALQDSSVSDTEGAHSLGTTYETRLLAADIFTDPDVSSGANYGLAADFSPKDGSVLLGAADPTYSPDHDITGAARSDTTPTIGAYE